MKDLPKVNDEKRVAEETEKVKKTATRNPVAKRVAAMPVQDRLDMMASLIRDLMSRDFAKE